MTNTSSALGTRAWKWPILMISAALVLLGAVNAHLLHADADGVGYMLRVTARIAFVFLMLAYIARPVQRLFERSVVN